MLEAAAARGAWIELDGISPASLTAHVDLVAGLRAQGHLNRLLISHDAGWYRVGEPGGAPEKFRGYDTLFTDFIPAIRAKGFSDSEVRQLLETNPARALSGQG